MENILDKVYGLGSVLFISITIIILSVIYNILVF